MDILNEKIKELIVNNIDPDDNYTIDIMNILISDGNWKQNNEKLDLVYNHLLSLIKDKFEKVKSDTIDLLGYLIKYSLLDKSENLDNDFIEIITDLWLNFHESFESINKFKEYFCNIYNLNELFDIALYNIMENADLIVFTKSQAIEKYKENYKLFIDKISNIDNLLNINLINKILDREEN